MLLLKQGFPQEGELVLCTVTKIYHSSIFAELDEYKKSGLIHISEVSPGRIRNIREFVTEGKKIVCVILRIDQEKGHIDLSLRRVNERQRKEKNENIKQEQKSEKIVEMVAKEHKTTLDSLYKIVFAKISQQYSTLNDCFQDVAGDLIKLEDLGIDKQIASELTEMIKVRMKPPEVTIKGRFTIKSYEPAGIEDIKQALKKGEAVDEKIKIMYEGAGKYHISITDSNYKDAEKIMEKLISTVTKEAQKKKCIVSFDREETKK